MALDKVSYHLESAINEFGLSEDAAHEGVATLLGFFLGFIVANNLLSDDEYNGDEIIEMKKLLGKDNFDLVKLVTFYFDDMIPESFFKKESKDKLINYYQNEYLLYDYVETFKEEELFEVKPTKENFDKIFRVIYKKYYGNI